MRKIGIAGFGTVGRRVSRAVTEQPDMKILGIAKKSSSPESEIIENNYDLYGVSKDAKTQMEDSGHTVLGTLDELSSISDVIVDCSPSGFGAKNKEIYSKNNTPAIFQGGEESSVADKSFNSYVGLSRGVDYSESEYLRVVSCNTTGLSRMLSSVEDDIDEVDATLIRRGADPDEPSRGPINDVVHSPSVPSHHSSDVNELIPDIDIQTTAVEIPTTSMHMHSVTIRFSEPDFNFQNAFSKNRVELIPNKYDIRTSGRMNEIAGTRSRPYGSVWENTVWEDSIMVDGRKLKFFQGVHQRSITVPETIDAIRSLLGDDIEESIRTTDISLGIQNSLF